MMRQQNTRIVLILIVLFGSVGFSFSSYGEEAEVPDWLRNVVIFWSNGQINDDEFLNAIQWLIDNNLLKTQSQTTFKDNGNFYAIYNDGNNPKLKEFEKGFQNSKALDVLAEKINPIFNLPYDIPIIMSECGTPNAYYDSSKKELIFCYELPAYFFVIFKSLGYDDSEASKKTAEVFGFVALHELGHTLIDVYDLPTTGMEEDAVDQLASLILSKKDSGLSALETTSIWFAFESVKDSTNTQLPFWDEHSLNQQRFFNVICWMYGSNPEEYSQLISSKLLPEDRAIKCSLEYEKISESWKSLLAPYSNLEKLGLQ